MPEYILITVTYNITLTTTKIKIRDKEEKTFVEIDYLGLNMIENENYGVVGVYVLYQFRLQYRVKNWKCQRKWQQLNLLWGLGVSETNAYVLYQKLLIV